MVTSQTPPRLNAQERRRQLVEAAIDLFSQKGFGGTTTKEIAAAAGVNEAIIFRHFATKQHLYEAILEHKLADGGFEAKFTEVRLLMRARDDKGVIRWLAQAVLRVFREDARFEKLMLFAALEGHEIAVMRHSIVNPYVQCLREYFAARSRDGALANLDADIIICAAVGGAKQYAMSKYLFCKLGQQSDDGEVAAALAEILFRGLQAMA